MGGNMAVDGNYTFAYTGTGNGHVNDVKNWGWNTVRLTLVCSNPTSGVDSLIKEYTAQKIVVTIGCWDVTGADAAITDSRVTSIMNLFDTFATAYKNNPYVWFDPFNEPISWTNTTLWSSLQSTALSRIRAIAPNNIYVADAPRYGQGVEYFYGANPVTSVGAGKCNVLYSWHAYGAMSGDTSTQANMDSVVQSSLAGVSAANIPLIMGEMGDPSPSAGNDNGTGNNRRAAISTIKYAPQYGYGLQWWHINGDSNATLTFSLMADKTKAPWSAALTGTGLTDTGLQFWNLSHNKPALGKFVGNLADSHCAL